MFTVTIRSLFPRHLHTCATRASEGRWRAAWTAIKREPPSDQTALPLSCHTFHLTASHRLHEDANSEPRFPKPSSKGCREPPAGLVECTLRASLSGTVLQRMSWTTSGVGWVHTPSIAFLHLPPNSARFGYATERGTLYLPALSTDAVSALRRFGY